MAWKDDLYESVRVNGGRLYQVLGSVHMAGRAKHRKPRIEVLKELDLFLTQNQRILDQDMHGASVDVQNRAGDISYIQAAMDGNQAHAILIAKEMEVIARNDPHAKQALEWAARRTNETFSPLVACPDRIDANRIPDTQWIYLSADNDALRIRLRGAIRHGQPYMEDMEDALRDLWDSISTSIGSNHPGSGRFQTRRADGHRDAILDLTALRWLDRFPALTLRDSYRSVSADLYAHVSGAYQDWEDMQRGMAMERDKLYDAYKDRLDQFYDELVDKIPKIRPANMSELYGLSGTDIKLYGPRSDMPIYTDLSIPHGKSWEVIAKIYSDIQHSGPGGPSWGENMHRIWEETTGRAFGRMPSPERATRDIVIHGPDRSRIAVPRGYGQLIETTAEPVPAPTPKLPSGPSVIIEPGQGRIFEEAPALSPAAPASPAPAVFAPEDVNERRWAKQLKGKGDRGGSGPEGPGRA